MPGDQVRSQPDPATDLYLWWKQSAFSDRYRLTDLIVIRIVNTGFGFGTETCDICICAL